MARGDVVSISYIGTLFVQFRLSAVQAGDFIAEFSGVGRRGLRKKPE